eukprot:scaffold2047_cov129-Cylindrotheca_fusiformis.AAC.31
MDWRVGVLTATNRLVRPNSRKYLLRGSTMIVGQQNGTKRRRATRRLRYNKPGSSTGFDYFPHFIDDTMHLESFLAHSPLVGQNTDPCT